jgi:hypothetical protein
MNGLLKFAKEAPKNAIPGFLQHGFRICVSHEVKDDFRNDGFVRLPVKQSPMDEKTIQFSFPRAWSQTRTLIVWPLLLSVSAGLGSCALFRPLTYDALEQRVRMLEADKDSLELQLRAREKEAAHLQLETLEKTARITELEDAVKQREQELTHNRERLLRMDTRIQALTGPAQAASAIAEAEAAYLIALAQGPIQTTEAISDLLSASTSAYEAGNYGQAADLADQVMQRLYRDVEALPSEQVASVKYPESPFTSPLPFLVRVNSHVRQGPGMGFPPKAVLPAKTPVTGRAVRGQWVKIAGPDQLQGWIYRKLLAVPD